MPTMKMKIETEVSVEGDYIRVYESPADHDQLVTGPLLLSISYADLTESVLDDLEDEGSELGHTGALELAAKFAKVAEDIRTYVRDDLLRTGRDE